MDINETKAIRSTLLEETGKCRACRFCVDVCPTYQASEGVESISSYGRLQILKYLINGLIDEDDPILYPLYTCLQCGRCDIVCKGKGQNLEVSNLIRLGRSLLSRDLVRGGKNEDL